MASVYDNEGNVVINSNTPIKSVTGYYQGETLSPKKPFHRESYNIGISTSIFNTQERAVGNQGVDNEGDIFFFCLNGELRTDSSDQKIAVVITNAKEKTKLGEFIVSSPIKKTHGNNLNVGNRYDAEDKFPLLYISATYNDYRCFVLRVNDDASSYTLVQNILYSGTKFSGTPNSIDWLVDIERNKIYAYASYFAGGARLCKFAKFNLPSPTIGDVTLTDSDCVEYFEVENCRIAQGAKVVGNRIFIGLGYTPGDEWLKAIDIDSHQIVTTLPLTYEPEGMCLWNDKIAVIGGGFYIHTFEDV